MNRLTKELSAKELNRKMKEWCSSLHGEADHPKPDVEEHTSGACIMNNIEEDVNA